MRVWIVAVALILAAAAYSSAIPGGFVSDDDVQIVRNVQIQDGRLFWRALTSDVWSFAGSGDRTSNYWRPAFISWLALNYRLFGRRIVRAVMRDMTADGKPRILEGEVVANRTRK